MVDGGEPGVDSRDEGKHTGRNDLLFVEKMMWMGERVLQLPSPWSSTSICSVFVEDKCHRFVQAGCPSN